MMIKKLLICFAILTSCQLCFAQDEEKEYEHLFQLWQKERKQALKEWESEFTTSSLGPNYATKSYNALVAKSAKLIPFLLRHIKAKNTFDEYQQYMDLLAAILKIRFERKFLKDENILLLTDYNIKYPSIVSLRKQGREHDFVYEQELWWDHGRNLTPAVFARKYQAYSEARKEGDNKTIAQEFERLQDMGIIILPNLLEKMEEGDETLLPMFVYLSGQKNLKDVSECRKWWDANKGDFHDLLDY